MGQEIERKFLLGAAPGWLGDHRTREIAQGYLAVAEDAEVRVRRADDEFVLTVKRGTGQTREEVEIALAEDQFRKLWPLTETRRVSKRRSVVPLTETLSAEVDVYAGDLEGLVTAEVEFGSEEDARAFAAPDWLEEEVTGDRRYANQQLAIAGLPSERR